MNEDRLLILALALAWVVLVLSSFVAGGDFGGSR